MMDHMVSRERDYYEVDLESGGTTSEEEGREDRASRVGQAKKSLDKVWDGFMGGGGGIDKSIRGDRGDVSTFDSISISSDVPAESGEELRDRRRSEVEEHTIELLEKKRAKEKQRKKTISKKPPRPPRGPSLDAADQKMVKEISELAMLKRARIERMKASKKMKAAKAASPNSNLCAMIITIMFCLVIIFQGMFSRGSPQVGSDGSTTQEAAMNGRRLISVQYFKNISPKSSEGSGSSVPDSQSPRRTSLPSGLPPR